MISLRAEADSSFRHSQSESAIWWSAATAALVSVLPITYRDGPKEETALSSSSTSRPARPPLSSHRKQLTAVGLDPGNTLVATGSFEGTMRIGPTSGEEPRLLLGQEGEGAIYSLAFSPDGRWIAASGESFRIYVWPVPDISKPPLHRRSHDELLALLRSHTNLEALPDPASSTGYRLEVGRFRAWAPMPRMVTRTFVVIAVLLAFVNGAGAQEQHAAIEGVVRDTLGGVVPGVLVVARSTSGLAVEAVTDDLGKYRLASLPSTGFDLTARLTGFAPARVTNVNLALGVQLNVDMVLTPAGPDETVVVVSSAPLIAVTQSSRATSMRSEAIEKMPRGRDFTSLAVQAPGTNQEPKLGGISVDGASGAENRVVIDGIETTNTWVGTPGQFLVTDFVEELQVKSSGYAAEYGGSTGGVLNVITRSGTNTWHGDALFYWSDDALDAAPRPTLQIVPTDNLRAEYVTYPEDRYSQLEAGFTLGGPILRDRAWFFGGYIPAFRPLDRTVTFLADGSTSTYRQDLTRRNAAVNVLAQLGPRWRVRGAFSTGSQRQEGLLRPSMARATRRRTTRSTR